MMKDKRFSSGGVEEFSSRKFIKFIKQKVLKKAENIYELDSADEKLSVN